MAARAAMTVGLLALVAIFAAVLLQKDQRRSGSDLTPNGAYVAGLNARQSTCQRGEILPADTSAIEATIGSYGTPGPPVNVTLRGARGELLGSGSLKHGWRQGLVTIPIEHVSRATEGVEVCLRDGGPGPIAIAGALPDPGLQMTVAGRQVEGRLRYDYLRPGRESWLGLLPTIVHRTTFAKSGLVRHWAWAAALALMLASVAIAARTVVRVGPR